MILAGIIAAGEGELSVLFVPEIHQVSPCAIDLLYLNELHQRGFAVDDLDVTSQFNWKRIRRYHCLVIYDVPYPKVTGRADPRARIARGLILRTRTRGPLQCIPVSEMSKIECSISNVHGKSFLTSKFGIFVPHDKRGPTGTGAESTLRRARGLILHTRTRGLLRCNSLAAHRVAGPVARVGPLC